MAFSDSDFGNGDNVNLATDRARGQAAQVSAAEVSADASRGTASADRQLGRPHRADAASTGAWPCASLPDPTKPMKYCYWEGCWTTSSLECSLCGDKSCPLHMLDNSTILPDGFPIGPGKHLCRDCWGMGPNKCAELLHPDSPRRHVMRAPPCNGQSATIMGSRV